MLIWKSSRVLALIVMLCPAAGAWGLALAEPQNMPVLRLRVEPDNGVVVGSYRFLLSFTNTTTETVAIRRIELMLPDVIQSVRSDRPTTSWDYKQEVLPGNSRTIVHTLPATAAIGYGPWLLPFTNYREMLSLPGKYPFRVLLSYNRSIGDHTLQDLEAETEVSIHCTMASKLWGGVCGALLLGLFFLFYEARRQGSVSTPSFASYGIRVLWMAPSGAVSAITLILILNRFEDIGLPINLQVNDFYGAVVLGLFTYKLGDWLYGKLSGDNGAGK